MSAESRDSTTIKMKLISRKAVHLIAFLAAFFSSVAGKTEAGKNYKTNYVVVMRGQARPKK